MKKVLLFLSLATCTTNVIAVQERIAHALVVTTTDPTFSIDKIKNDTVGFQQFEQEFHFNAGTLEGVPGTCHIFIAYNKKISAQQAINAFLEHLTVHTKTLEKPTQTFTLKSNSSVRLLEIISVCTDTERAKLNVEDHLVVTEDNTKKGSILGEKFALAGRNIDCYALMRTADGLSAEQITKIANEIKEKLNATEPKN